MVVHELPGIDEAAGSLPSAASPSRPMKKQNPMEKAEKEIAANLPKGMIGEDTEDVADAPEAEMEVEEESTDARRA